MIGIFGGAFDPVHRGHLALATAAHQQLGLESVRFIPLGVPPHRSQPQASAEFRVKLLRAALEPYPEFEVDTLEVEKTSPSWTVETLEQLNQSMPEKTLCLLLGSDAFKPLNTWYRWRTLTDYCHIVVVSRKGDGQELDAEVADFLAEKRTETLAEMSDGVSGRLLWLEADVPELSSTQVREQIAKGQSLTQYVPSAVAALIKEYRLYGYG